MLHPNFTIQLCPRSGAHLSGAGGRSGKLARSKLLAWRDRIHRLRFTRMKVSATRALPTRRPAKIPTTMRALERFPEVEPAGPAPREGSTAPSNSVPMEATGRKLWIGLRHLGLILRRCMLLRLVKNMILHLPESPFGAVTTAAVAPASFKGPQLTKV